MKKNILLICLSILLLISCSKGDEDTNSNNPSNEDYYLLERIIDSDGAALDFSYNEDKLNRITVYEGYREYTYSGDLITKMEGFTNNGESDGYNEIYEYENGKMIRKKGYHNSELVMDYLISYPNSNQIKIEDLLKDFVSISHLDSKGNIIRVDYEQDGVLGSEIYTYDNKNGPFKNIKGVNFLINLEGFYFVFAQNNMLTKTGSEQVQDITYSYEYNYTYNDKNYPILMEWTSIYTIGTDSFTNSVGPFVFSYK